MVRQHLYIEMTPKAQTVLIPRIRIYIYIYLKQLYRDDTQSPNCTDPLDQNIYRYIYT